MIEPTKFLKELSDEGLFRALRNIECLPDGMARMADGREVVNLASNDYLGLAHHPAIISRMKDALGRYGAGAMASRLVTGTRDLHTQLEQELARMKHAEAALCFSAGYTTSVGVISSLVGKDDFVVMDKLSHASLIDGAKLSGATIRTFLHNNVASLDAKLAQIRAKFPHAGILVVTESVFSMDGDRAPLAEIVDIKNKWGAVLLVDEAHGFGVLGEYGAGLAEELGVSEGIEFQMGTLSKSAGLSGGYVATSRAWADTLINSARSFIYSTAPSPVMIAGALESLGIIRSDEGKKRREQVRLLAKRFSTFLGEASRPTSSIFPVVIGSNEDALAASQSLLEKGFLAPAIRFPTVPKGTARLRITLTAAHSIEQVDQLINLMK